MLATRGRIYQYVGDEAVVTWTTERGLSQGNCLRCVFLVSERIHEQRDRYLARYGIVPEFKAGLHGGPVVTAEIGDIKKDIVHSGDTVNTAARVEAQCRPLERRVLVSEALLNRCRVPEELQVEDMGERESAREGRGAPSLQRVEQAGQGGFRFRSLTQSFEKSISSAWVQSSRPWY